jgi:hypothetical protein
MMKSVSELAELLINIDEMICFLEQKIAWHQPKVTEEVLA